jgi:hypothetical protein
MNQIDQSGNTAEEMIKVLTAVGVVSRRLARKLTILAEQDHKLIGGKSNEQPEICGLRLRKVYLTH